MSIIAYDAGKQDGIKEERQRILDLLIENKVMRIDGLGILCFVNCDTLKVEYSHLFDDIIKGETNGTS